MFDNNSRYKQAQQYQVQDSRGRKVLVAATPPSPVQGLLGYHVLRQGQRTDHLAAKYLNDPTAFWRIAEANGVMLAETLTEQKEIAIPVKQ